MLPNLEFNSASSSIKLTTKENPQPSTSKIPNECEDYSIPHEYEDHSIPSHQLNVIDEFLKKIDGNYCFVLNESEPDRNEIIKRDPQL